MARPARVRMRRRKPCVLARRRLFGWKVRLLTRFSVGRGAGRLSSTRAPWWWGRAWSRRPQSASPWCSGVDPADREDAHGAMGMRKRSQTRSVNDTGAPEGGSNRAGGVDGTRRTDRSWAVRRGIQADTPRVDRIRAPDDCQGRARVVGFGAYGPGPPMHRLWTNVWTTRHRSPGQRTAEGRPSRSRGTRAATGPYRNVPDRRARGLTQG